jgi:hypothetical protein
MADDLTAMEVNDLNTPKPILAAELRAAAQKKRENPSSRRDGPICFVDHGVYTVQYETVQFDFNYIMPDRDKGIWAEMEVIQSRPIATTLLRSRINLLKGTSRREAVRDLTNRASHVAADWDEKLEEASYWVVERYRIGEPGVLLQDVVAPETPDWLIPELALSRLPTIWFGDAGVGKSLMALAAGISIAGGAAILGPQPTTSVNVAFLDWEFEPWQHKSRLDRIWPLSEALNLYYYRCHTSFAEQVDRFRTEFRRNQIGFVIIDSAAMACGGEPETADSALNFFNALNSFELGSLVIAHTTKNGSDDKPFGSRFWDASARCTWLVKAQQEPGRGDFDVAMFNKKCSVAAKAKPRGFRVSFRDDVIAFKSADIVRDLDVELSSGMRLVDRIAAAIARAPLSYSELSDALDVPIDSVRKTLQRHDSHFVKLHDFDDRVMRFGLATPEKVS